MEQQLQFALDAQNIISQIENNYRTYLPGKASRLLMKQLDEIIAQSCITQDCSTLVSVLGYIKENEKIHPNEFENARPVCLKFQNRNIELTMTIAFHKLGNIQKGKVTVKIILTYYNPHYSKIITSQISRPENEIEIKLKQLVQEIETKYSKFSSQNN